MNKGVKILGIIILVVALLVCSGLDILYSYLVPKTAEIGDFKAHLVEDNSLGDSIPKGTILWSKPLLPEERKNINKNDIVFYSDSFSIDGQNYDFYICDTVQKHDENGFVYFGTGDNTQKIKSTKIEEKAEKYWTFIAPLSSFWLSYGILISAAVVIALVLFIIFAVKGKRKAQ